MCMSACTRFITSIGHGEPAMMPVRKGGEVELREARVVQLAQEHGGHASKREVQRSACTAASTAMGS
jgi:hypothetical protein